MIHDLSAPANEGVSEIDNPPTEIILDVGNPPEVS
jgi:hypothetical protein